MNSRSEPMPTLFWIKLLHTAVWLFFVLCIAGIPLATAGGHLRWAGWLSALVLAECAILAVNGGRCPLTDVAGQYTDQRADNFDIYLPAWVARHNKVIFGVMFVAGEIYFVGRWWRS